ncbi:FMN-binding protein [Alkaliphilus hydrothermalis]|uniref:Na+-transporting NADH:ubiquinone oxidoreductase subunit C n=1 Tax=Alkaliphilus hydrothermalis TaxID=1482730 RepID=A0ABS2NPP3_9FIRM|nr:FMN-binding protein [Alkaliphilus hydrothermalis]MBM7614891.1 Na+-transporting NADH:ubiquinone oxidoreductase subunit C [Alkaliphilus hydrothermalis]
MKKMNTTSILFMIVITVIFTGALAFINEVTKEQIDLNQELKEHKSMLYVLNIPLEDKSALEVSNFRSDYIKEANKNDLYYYEAFENHQLTAYIFPFQGEAVWGTLKGLISLTPDLKEVRGIDFLSHSETPGLGGRIDEKQFKEQFRGITINPQQQDSNYINYHPHPNAQIDAITGATGTSNAVKRILNNNLEIIINGMEGEHQ